jgi:hypothetical protein
VKLLLELVHVANLKRISKIEIFDSNNLKNKSSKFNEFYLSLINGALRTDRDAATLLYDTTPADDRYRQLKSRFRKRLLNTVFFLNVNAPLRTKHEQIIADLHRDWALVNILRLYEAMQNVTSMARQILHTAEKIQCTPMKVQVLHLLSNVAAQQGLHKEYKVYSQQLTDEMEVLNKEIEAEQILLRLCLVQSGAVDGQELDWEYWRQKLISLYETSPTERLKYISLLVGAMQYYEEGKYDLVNMICLQADASLTQADGVFSLEDRFRIRYLHLQSLYALGTADEAMKLVESCLRDFEDGSSYWLSVMDIAFLLALKSEHYGYAFSILQRILTHKQHARWSEVIKSQWALYQLALYVALQWTPQNKPILQSKLFASLNLESVIAKGPISGKNLRVYALWEMILKILLLIEHRLLKQAGTWIERLQKSTRSLPSSDQHARLIAFARCLQLLHRSDFNLSETRFDNKYYLVLLNKPHRYEGKVDQLELIPYHQLWEIIFERLKIQ